MTELERRYRLVFENMTQGIYYQNADGSVADVNPAALRILGLSREEFLKLSSGEKDWRLVKENQEELPRDLYPAMVALRTGEEVRGFVAGIRTPGQQAPVWVRMDAFPLFRPGEPAPHQVLVCLDDKRAETELLEVKELFTLFMKYSPIYTYIKQLEGDRSRVLLLSDNFVDMVGRPAEELRGHTMEEMFPPEFARKITEDDLAVLKEGKAVQLEEELNGLKYTTIKFPIIREGRESLLAGFTIDVTEQKRAEEEIRRQARLLDVAHDAIIVRDMQGKISYWNEGAASQYGFTGEEARGRIIQDLLQTRFDEPVEVIIGTLCRDGIWEGELRHITRDGTLITVASRWVLQRNAEGEPLTILEINHDITQMKEAERQRDHLQFQMFQSQKLESLGLLAGGIAHDFNNILTSIMGNTELALLQVGPESPAAENLRRLDKSTRRAAELVKQMLACSGKGRFSVESVDLNRLVEEMVNMLESSISKKASLRLNFTKPLRRVQADATQMRQVVMNLVVNASEALGEGVGDITVATAQSCYDQEALQQFWFSEELEPGWYVCLLVTDTGCGIAPEHQEKVFDPFFSTKFTGRGLGMAAVLGILRGHKGAIKLESDVGRGTTFTVVLPAKDEIFEAEEPSQPPREPRDPLAAKGVVLLVDDEEAVCDLVGQMLALMGYEVVTARDGGEAVEIYRGRSDFDFVVLDLTMPVLDGEQVFEELRRINPRVQVIITSGYSEQDVARRFAGKGVSAFLQKPFEMSALRRAIQ